MYNKIIDILILKWGSVVNVELLGEKRPMVTNKTLEYLLKYYKVKSNKVKNKRENKGVIHNLMKTLGIV
jgi:hypothetical protein